MIDQYVKIILIFPLIAFIINFFLMIFKKRPLFGMINMLIALIISVAAIFPLFPIISRLGAQHFKLFNWIFHQEILVEFKIVVDEMSLVLITLILTVALVFALHIIISQKKRAKDPVLLPAISFAGILIMLAENTAVMLSGWFTLGLCSYLMSNLDDENTANRRFVLSVERIGDFCVIAASIILVNITGTTSFEFPPLDNPTPLFIPCLLFLLGAATRIMQFPFHAYLANALPDLSAPKVFLYAVLMPMSGLLLLCRIAPAMVNFSGLMNTMTSLGILSMFLGSAVMFVQQDLKKIVINLAIFQLGLIFMTCGLTAFSYAISSMFSFVFYGTILFLTAQIIPAKDRDIFKLRNLKKTHPVLFTCIILGLLAASSIPGFSGFFINSAILWHTLNIPDIGVYYYIFGLFAMIAVTFFLAKIAVLLYWDNGKTLKTKYSILGQLPLGLMAIVSLMFGFLNLPYFFSQTHGLIFSKFVGHVVPEQFSNIHGGTEIILTLIFALLAIIVSVLAYFIYIRDEKHLMALKTKNSFHFLWNIAREQFYINNFFSLVIHRSYIFGIKKPFCFFEKRLICGTATVISNSIDIVSRVLDKSRPRTLEINIIFFLFGAGIILATLTLRLLF